MSSKHKRKLIRAKSHESQNATTVGEEDDSADNSTVGSTDGGEKSFHKRQEFICSTAHNAHLEEDYLEDKSQLFGRQLSTPTSSKSIRRGTSSKQSKLKHVSSEILHRKSPVESTNDTRSLRSVARESDAANKPEQCNSILSPVHEENAVKKRQHRALQNDFRESLDDPTPVKPPRKTRHSARSKNQSSEPVSPGAQSAQSQTSNNEPEEACGGENPVVSLENDNGQVSEALLHEDDLSGDSNDGQVPQKNPRVIKRKSSIRPLRSVASTDTPKVYQRHSLTHKNSFSGDISGEELEGMPLSPVRHRLQKRESVIHSQREISLDIGLPVKPQFNNGRFENPLSWFKENGGSWRWFNYCDLLRWKLFGRNNSAVPSRKEELNAKLPVFPLEVAEISSPPENGIRVTWIGHASLLVQFDNISILTDPIFSGFVGFSRIFGVKRICKMPGTVHDLPRIDAVVISHNHYDHLDRSTVIMLNARFGHDIHWFVPFGLAQWMRSSGCTKVTELTWWEEAMLPHKNATFVFTPAQHWSRRTLFNTNKSLWGSWSVIGPQHKFFFTGDSGYCSGFKQIGEKYGPFDLAAIPIGSYHPRWVLSPQHVDPEKAVEIHIDIKAKHSIGIHWGTFILSDEHYLEPPKKFKEAARNKDLEEDECFVLHHGESRLILVQGDMTSQY